MEAGTEEGTRSLGAGVTVVNYHWVPDTKLGASAIALQLLSPRSVLLFSFIVHIMCLCCQCPVGCL